MIILQTSENEEVTAALRRDLLQFFAGCFVESMGESAYALLKNEETTRLFEVLGVIDPYSKLKKLIETETYQELHQEVFDCFVVPGQRFVPLIQSVYVDERLVGEARKKGLTMGDSAQRVLATYREAGFEPDSTFPLYPDHLSVELSFLSRLAGREKACAELGQVDEVLRWRKSAIKFAESNLLAWLPLAQASLAKIAETKFASALLDLLVSYLTVEFASQQDTA